MARLLDIKKIVFIMSDHPLSTESAYQLTAELLVSNRKAEAIAK
jgi:hypothetical protein